MCSFRWIGDELAQKSVDLIEKLRPVDHFTGWNIRRTHTSPVILLRADLTVPRARFSDSPTDTAVEMSSSSIWSRSPSSAALQAAQNKALLTPSVTKLATKSTSGSPVLLRVTGRGFGGSGRISSRNLHGSWTGSRSSHRYGNPVAGWVLGGTMQ